MTAVQLCLLIGMTGVAAAFLALLIRAEQQLTRLYAERRDLRQQLADERGLLAVIVAERDQLAVDAHLHETWTIGGGGAWAA